MMVMRNAFCSVCGGVEEREEVFGRTGDVSCCLVSYRCKEGNAS